MKESRVKFTTPEMLEVYFKTNDDFLEDREAVEVSTSVLSRYAYQSDTSAVVQMLLEVGAADKDEPFHLKIKYQVDIEWEQAEFQDEQARETILTQNAPLLLLSYARPAIATITNFSRYASYNLPFLDLRQK